MADRSGIEEGFEILNPHAGADLTDELGESLEYWPDFDEEIPMTCRTNSFSGSSRKGSEIDYFTHPSPPVAAEQHRPGAEYPTTSFVATSRPSVDSGDRQIRCWEHGCDGRTFSTRSNLSRHQREKANQTPSFSCPKCGVTFRRRTAAKRHQEAERCLAWRVEQMGQRPKPQTNQPSSFLHQSRIFDNTNGRETMRPDLQQRI